MIGKTRVFEKYALSADRKSDVLSLLVSGKEQHSLSLGLVDEVVPAELLDARCVELAEGLGSLSGDAVRQGLEFVPRLLPGDPNAVVDGRLNCQAAAHFKEGIMAFREKRAPVWPSHEG